MILTWCGLGDGVLYTTPGRNKGTDSVEPRESTDLEYNVDSRPSKVVLFPYFLPFVPCLCIHICIYLSMQRR